MRPRGPTLLHGYGMHPTQSPRDDGVNLVNFRVQRPRAPARVSSVRLLRFEFDPPSTSEASRSEMSLCE